MALERLNHIEVQKNKQKENYLKRVGYVAEQVTRMRVNLTEIPEDWQMITNVLAGYFKEEGRQYYHQFANIHPEYIEKQANEAFNAAMGASKIRAPVKFFQIVENYNLRSKIPVTVAEYKKEKQMTDIIGDDVLAKEFLEYAIYEESGMYWSLDNREQKYCISNFTLKILYFVDSSDEEAFRVIEIKNVHGHTRVLKLSTDDFEAVGTFKKAVARKGNFLWKGGDVDLIRLKDKLQRDERHTIIVKQLGWNKTYKFYAWANGVFVAETNEFMPIDEYGIVTLEITNKEGVKAPTNFFLPALSKIFADKEEMFVNEKKFIYKQSKFTFKEWAAQYCLVYGQPGQIALVFFVMAIFSDIIYKGMGTRFPILFPYGKRGTGKGKLIESLMKLFGDKQESIGLGGNSTTIGFLRVLAQLINAIVHLDEYKNTIDKRKIETLKEIYDRRPQTRGQKTMGFETNTVPVNSAVVMSGQEMPTAEPALFTRVILTILTETKFTQEQVDELKKLERMEVAGISCVTVELLKHRIVFFNKWAQIYDAEHRSFKSDPKHNEVDERMITNYAALVATAELIGSLETLPFNVMAFRELAKKKMLEQFFILRGSDDTSKFWQTIEGLFTKGIIREGLHFKLINGQLQIRIQSIYQDYADTFGKRKDANVLDKPTLEKYLESDGDSFICKTKKSFSDGQKWCMIFHYNQLGIDLINEPDIIKARLKYAEMKVDYMEEPEYEQGMLDLPELEA